jgi:hypothetical protein
MDTLDPTKHQPNPLRLTGIAVLALTFVLIGCPRKITEKIPVPCDQQGGGPPPSVHELVTIAVLGSGSEHRAVVATSTYARVVRLNSKIGSEGAMVIRLGVDTVTAKLNGRNIQVPSKDKATGTGGPSGGAGATSSSTSGVVDPIALTAWRVSVMNAVKRGEGVPHDMFMALALALGDPTRGGVESAMKLLGWSAAPELHQIYLTRLQVEGGRVRIEGVAPNQGVSKALVRRLRKAGPYIQQVTGGSGRLVTEGYQFIISFATPMVTAADIAQDGSAAGAKTPAPLTPKARQRLQAAARDIPGTAQVAKVEQLIRVAADRALFQISQITQRSKKLEEGSLGRATLNITATGSMKSVQPFLKFLEKASNASLPLVIDPVTIEASVLRASVHIVYAAGGIDTRTPAPAPFQSARTDLPNWSRARKLKVVDIRDPFSPR